MADAADGEIPKLVRPEMPRLDVEAPQHPLTQSVAVTKVLEDDNLLIEIIVRVGFPTTLVRAALVCKRWLDHASDPKFLIRFRKLHPPRLLGYYISESSFLARLVDAGHSVLSTKLDGTRFIPLLPQPPELAGVIRRLESYNLGTHEILHCQNGSIFTSRRDGTSSTYGVHRPLCTEKGMQIVPPLPHAQGHNRKNFGAIVSKQEGSSLSYLYVSGEFTGEARKSTIRVSVLQEGVWRMCTSATCLHGLHFHPKVLLVDDKIYMSAANSYNIIVLDMMASTFSAIQLPQGVKYRDSKTMLSGADDASGIYLINVKKFQLCIWLHKGDNWLLIDTICLNEMSILGMSDHTLEDKDIANLCICQVGDNGRFVFLRMGKCIFYLDIRCKTMCKVYENTVENRGFDDSHAVMMMWPPTFPALNGDRASKLSDGQ